MDGNIYMNRSMFEIAKNAKKGIEVVGIWYRYSATEYWVLGPKAENKGFNTVGEALAYFEEQTA